jgi:hypothetical protein
MKKFPWLMLVVFVVVLLVAFAVAMPFFARGARVGGAWGYMPWHMGAWGMMGSMPFLGGLFMIGLLLVPLAILALAVVGVVSLIRRARQP